MRLLPTLLRVFVTAVFALVLFCIPLALIGEDTTFSGGAHEALPVFLRPHRPLVVRLINGLGVVLGPAGLFGLDLAELIGLEEGALLQEACETALPGQDCDLDGPAEIDPRQQWRQGLRMLLTSYREDSRLTFLGHIIAKGQTLTWLVARARLIHEWNKELRADGSPLPAVERPIFIAGLPRTGTTFLHNLLSAGEGQLQSPRHWELVEPIPPPSLGEAGSPEHLASVQGRLEQYMQLLPGIELMHPMDSTMAEECVVTMSHTFSSLLFEATFNVSSYMDWLLAPGHDFGHVLRYHKRFLQFLAARRQSPPTRWLLKTPWNLALLDDIQRAYPDATVIHTHRRPSEVMASSASVHAKTWSAGSDVIDLRSIADSQIIIYENLLQRAMAARRRWGGGGTTGSSSSALQVIDVHLPDLKAGPVDQAKRIYLLLGMEWNEDVADKIKAFLAKKTITHGRHTPSLKDFGLGDHATVNANSVFRQYCKEFRVDGC